MEEATPVRVAAGPFKKTWEKPRVRSKRNDLLQTGTATRADGSLGRKVRACTELADDTADRCSRLRTRERRRLRRMAARAAAKAAANRAAMPAHPSTPSKVSGLHLDSGLALRFDERTDANLAMDPHYVKGMNRQL